MALQCLLGPMYPCTPWLSEVAYMPWPKRLTQRTWVHGYMGIHALALHSATGRHGSRGGSKTVLGLLRGCAARVGKERERRFRRYAVSVLICHSESVFVMRMMLRGVHV